MSAVDTNRIARHMAANFYPTPPEATRALLSVETFDDTIHEPACGKGHISRELKAFGCRVLSTDLHDWGYGLPGYNFLAQLYPFAKHIVTNPPYGRGLADAFIKRALSLAAITGGKVAMLLNLSSLAHPMRTLWWKQHPPARLYAIDDTVCWPDAERAPPQHFVQHRYVWAVWEAYHSGRSSFWWLSASDFRQQPQRILQQTQKPLNIV
jgi:hypothetical protein